MKTFYSILSINIQPEINERLSVGLLMIMGEEIFFRYSVLKFSIIQKLTSRDINKATLNYLKLVENAIYSKEAFNLNQAHDFRKENKYDRLFSEQYIEYLSRYSNNLVSFSKPNFIDLEVNDQIFEVFYKKFIGIYETESAHVRRLDSFKKHYYPTIKSYFAVNQELNFTRFPGLITPVKIDLMGKNEIEVFGQAIDFCKKVNSIEYHIGNILQLKRAIPRAKQFIIGLEPDRKNEINHSIWNNIRHIPDFEYVDITEAERITQYAIRHGVTPLID